MLHNIYIEGTHAPGNNGPHRQIVSGSYSMGPAARLEMEIGGPNYFSDIDWVDVAGTIALGGTLEVDLIGGYVPTGPSGFPVVVSTSGRTGMFTNAILPDLPGGLQFELEYTPTVVNLAIGGIAGDYNKNSIVDTADYVVWRKTYLQSGSTLAADGDFDGTVDDDDYEVWLAAFGQSAPGSGAGGAAAVPEPSTFLLIGLAALMCHPMRFPNRPRSS
jgi:hypothetical protein